MKTITIPKSFGYPTTEVIANGKYYKLRSGEEITVEDHIAEIIENAIALAPKYVRYKSKFAQRTDGSLAELTEEDLEEIDAIANHTFNYCYKLKAVTIPDSITSIGDAAFYTCTDLESLKFAGKVNSIGKNTFQWCAKLKLVYLPETPPTLANVEAFANINANCVFYCKTQKSLDAYKAAANWSTLTGTYSFVVE